MNIEHLEKEPYAVNYMRSELSFWIGYAAALERMANVEPEYRLATLKSDLILNPRVAYYSQHGITEDDLKRK